MSSEIAPAGDQERFWNLHTFTVIDYVRNGSKPPSDMPLIIWVLGMTALCLIHNLFETIILGTEPKPRIRNKITGIFSATFDETKPMPELFQKFSRFFETCHLGPKSKTEPIDKRPMQSIALPLDEKLFNDHIGICQEKVKEDQDSEAEWAKFHKYSNWMTFAIQFSAVSLTQG